MEKVTKRRGPDKHPRRCRSEQSGEQDGERKSIAPFGDTLLDQTYRLESKDATPEGRQAALQEMEQYCTMLDGITWWEKRNRLNSEEVLYLTINVTGDKRVRSQAYKKQIQMRKRKVHGSTPLPQREPSAPLQGVQAG